MTSSAKIQTSPFPAPTSFSTSQYLLREAGASQKAIGADAALAFFHPNLFTYMVDRGPASSVPPSYIALGRACVAEDPQQRPTFDEVLFALEGVRRDLEQMKGEWAKAALAKPGLEPDPDESSGSLGGMISRSTLPAAGSDVSGQVAQSSTFSGGPAAGGSLGGASLGALAGSSDVSGRTQSSALGGGPGSGLGGALGGIPLMSSDVLASQAGSSSLLGGC